MTLAFDTSILIDLEKKDKKTLNGVVKLSKIYPLIPQLPFISHFEYIFGLKKRNPKRLNELLANLKKYPLLETTEKTSEIMSSLRIKYNKEGLQFSLADLLIASQVIENDLILLTKDNDFKKIKEVNCKVL